VSKLYTNAASNGIDAISLDREHLPSSPDVVMPLLETLSRLGDSVSSPSSKLSELDEPSLMTEEFIVVRKEAAPGGPIVDGVGGCECCVDGRLAEAGTEAPVLLDASFCCCGAKLKPPKAGVGG
jgi:hypothetical protein